MRTGRLVFLLLAVFISSLAASPRQGIVLDESGQGIGNARIVVRTTLGAELLQRATAPDGTFEVDSLPAGTYWLEVTASPFDVQRRRIDLGDADQPPLRIVLRLAPLQIEVTVTAQRGTIAELDKTAPLVPDRHDLDKLTTQVARNNFYTTETSERDERVMRFLNKRIKHVIYVVKENRTFDQVLGDLTNGANVDPSLVQFGEALTPNNHKLAKEFVTLDNFMNPGDGSMDGWSWTLQGRVTKTEAITQQINYAAVSRGLSYESEGANRGVPVNFPTVAQRDAAAGPAGTTNYSMRSATLPGGTANLLTGARNHASTDAPFGSEDGYIFNAVLNAGKTVRNYGFLVNNIGSIGTNASPVRDPFLAGVVQVAPLDPALAPYTDVYFRGYDQNYPDLWRYNEWKREFDQYVVNGNLPSLSLVRISHDHMGNFGSALAGVNTPETQQADCDLALGLMVEAVANSRYADDTLIVAIEDDVQDGPDHVDSHRGTIFFAGPYVKKGAVVSTRYSQVNLLRTIEDILGTEHINLNTAFQQPMADVFDIGSRGKWTYVAEASTVLAATSVANGTNPGLRYAKGPIIQPKHDAAYWEKVTAGFDFSEADQVPVAQFNRLLWSGLMGATPYPALRGRARNDLPPHLAWLQWQR
jgi:hypothetical protein